MKINYRKVNPYFFFIGIGVSVLISFLNSAVSEVDYYVYGWISIIACTLCFYRLNNGLIALIRGRFAKPKRSNLKFVDYDEIPIKDAKDFKNSIAYGEKSLIAYKLNSREVYQLIKQNDGLLIRRCYPEKGIGVVTDFDHHLKAVRDDSLIQYSAIKNVTYKISPNNFYLPVISISAGKKHFRFIGYLEPFSRADINAFFSDIVKVRGRNVQKSPEEQINESEHLAFKYNIIALLTCLITPSLYVAPSAVGSGASHILWMIYAMISVVLLIIYLYLAVAKSEKYKLDLITDNKSDGKKDVSVGLMLLGISLVFSMFFEVSVINIKWYLILVAVVFVILITLYFKGIRLPKFNDKQNRHKRLFVIIGAVVMFFISSSALVSAVNYAVPLHTQTYTCAVTQMYEEEGRRSTLYYAEIIVDGREQSIQIDDETYNSKVSRIDVAESTGILGVKYIVEE